METKHADPVLQYPGVSKVVAVLLILTLTAGACVVIGHGMFHGRPGLSDFAAYFAAANVVTHDGSPGRIYDDTWFVGKIRELGMPDTTMMMYVNPPPVALIMAPLASLSPATAKLVWNCFSLFLLICAVIVGARVFSIPKHSVYILLFLGMILLTIPFLRVLQRGQLYVVMLFLTLLLYQGARAGNSLLSGGALAGLLLLKYFGWLFLLFFVVLGRWKEVATAVGICLVAAICISLGFGFDFYGSHLERLLTAFSSRDLSITHLPSLPAFFGGFLVYHPLYNTAPLVDAPWLARIVTLLAVAAAAWYSFRPLRSGAAGAFHRTFFALIVLSVAATPLAAEHHFLIVTPALWYAFFASERPYERKNVLTFAVTAYLILGWFPAMLRLFGNPLTLLLVYPQLYGEAILWSLLVWGRRWRDGVVLADS